MSSLESLSDPDSTIVGPSEKDLSFFGFLKYMAIGITVTLLLLGGKILFEKWSWGHGVERWTYEFLQTQKAPFDPGKEIAIVVVDIGQQPGGTPDQATDRHYLRTIIEALVKREPTAIAIDEDFSTNGKGWVTEDDAEFFKFCLAQNVPIFLGVHEARAEDPDTWLGLPQFKEMAVTLIGPKGYTSRMPLWIKYPAVEAKLPSIGLALAREHLKSSTKTKHQWPAWAVYLTEDSLPGKQVHIVGDRDEFDMAETLVNYSKIELIQKLTPPTINTDFITNSNEMFRNKMVLIGAATYATDSADVPGRDENFAGVFVHASTAYTLAKEPLYEFTNSLRWKLDLGISVFVLLCVAVIRFVYGRRIAKSRSEKWQRRVVYITGFFVVVAGMALVRWGSVMWLDFILVMAAVLLHPKVDRRLKRLWKTIKRTAPNTAST